MDKRNVDGSNRSINQLYQLASDRDTFYIKMDDDIVYLPPSFGSALYTAAVQEKGKYSYWSPLVVSNAICSWLLKYHSRMQINANLMASAACAHGWRSPSFAEALHRSFLDALQRDTICNFEVPDFDVSLSRFSINCIGFWGEDVKRLGMTFCPLNVDDEEWISAVLPSLSGRPGRIKGRILVSHFSFFTQEEHLLQTNILESYYKCADISCVSKPSPKKKTMLQGIRSRFRRKSKRESTYTIHIKDEDRSTLSTDTMAIG